MTPIFRGLASRTSFFLSKRLSLSRGSVSKPPALQRALPYGFLPDWVASALAHMKDIYD
ncbi:MAG: hypothetical protein AABZ45_04440 [Pseudomonadota bacterium]